MSDTISANPLPPVSLTPARSGRLIRPVSALILLLVLFSTIGLYYVQANPPFEAPEEALHLTLVRDMVAGRQPLFAYQKGSIGEEAQPRVYYLLLAAPVGWADGALARSVPAPLGARKGPALALMVGRLCSLVFGIGALIGTYLLASTLFHNRRLALAAVAFQMLIPGFILTSSTVNNDNAANLFGALSLWLGARVVVSRQAGWKLWLFYGLCVIAAAFSKLTAVFVIPFFLATVLIAAWRHGSMRAKLMLAGVVAAALGVPVVVGVVDPSFRLARAATSIAGGGSIYSPVNIWWAVTNNSPGTVLDLLAQLSKTSLTVAGWQVSATPPGYVYAGAATIALLAVLGLVRYGLSFRGWRTLAPSTKLAIALLVGVQILVLVQLYLVGWGKPYTTYWWGITHARYVFPVVGFAALLIVAGIAALVPAALRQAFLALLLLVMLAHAVTVPFYRTGDSSQALFNDTVAAAEVPHFDGHSPDPIPFAAGITLLDTLISPTRALPGKPVRVQLLWRADANSEYDFRAFVHIVDSRGNQVAGSDITPTDYRFPTRLWRRGDIVFDDRELLLPSTAAAPGQYDIIAGVYRFYKGKNLVMSEVQKPGLDLRDNRLLLGRVLVPQPSFDSASVPVPAKAAFGDELLLRGANSLANDKAPGDTLSVTLYWQAQRALSSDWQISVQLVDGAGRLVAQRDGQPQQGQYPTSIWLPGETVIDTHDIALPATLQSGKYSVLVIVYSLTDQRRLQMVQPERSPSDFLLLGEVQIDKR